MRHSLKGLRPLARFMLFFLLFLCISLLPLGWAISACFFFLFDILLHSWIACFLCVHCLFSLCRCCTHSLFANSYCTCSLPTSPTSLFAIPLSGTLAGVVACASGTSSGRPEMSTRKIVGNERGVGAHADIASTLALVGSRTGAKQK